MNERRAGRWSGHWLLRDYGMVVALVLLVGLFSWLTLTDQYPTGEDAGRQVAARILARPEPARGVLVVVRDTPEDRAFADAVERDLRAGGATVLASVRGGAPEARQAIERIVAEGGSLGAIAANEVTAQWSVYDRFPQLASVPRVIPQPYRWPNFLKLSNLLGVANQTAIYALIAIGMTLVIVTGGIDLSVGSLVALSSVCTALVLRDWGGGVQAGPGAMAVAGLVGIAVSGMAGAQNGLLITRFRLPPFIVTLGMMMIASGLAFRLSEGRSIPELPARFSWLGRGQIVGVPTPVWLMLGGYLLAHFV
ncbi:MAG: ABC transporter permease, partial [Planctomycetaceae bacterium]